MALINCPECGKEISDKSKQCIHCGYPLEHIKNTYDKYNFYKVILVDYGTEKVKVIKAIRETTGMGLKDAKNFVESLPHTLLTGLSKDDCAAVSDYFSSLGAEIEIKPDTVSKEENTAFDLNALLPEKTVNFQNHMRDEHPKASSVTTANNTESIRKSSTNESNIKIRESFVTSTIESDILKICITSIFTVLGIILTYGGLFVGYGSLALTLFGILITIVFLIADITFIKELYTFKKYKQTPSDPHTIKELEKILKVNKASQELAQERLAKSREIEAAKKKQQYKLDHPKCPTCGGTNTRRITTTSRAVSITATGLASRKLGKTFECLDCKYTW